MNISRKIGLIGSALAGTILLFGSGCYNFRQGDEYVDDSSTRYNENGRVYMNEAGQPVYENGNITQYTSIDDINYRLDVNITPPCAVGETFEIFYTLCAKNYIKNVVLSEKVPVGSSLDASSPQSVAMNSDEVRWEIDTMIPGEVRTFSARFKARECGDLWSCATVTATAAACACVHVGEPMLTIMKECCEQKDYCVGDMIPFTIFVKNTGTFPAENVVVVDHVPEGLQHASMQKDLVLELGTIMPGECRTLNTCFLAVARGQFCNVAEVRSSTCSMQASCCVKVAMPELAIRKTGPARQYIGKCADYEITLTNTGDMDVNGVVVTDTVPQGAELVNSDGSSVDGCSVSWFVDSLPAGQSRTFNVTLTSQCVGTYCNSVAACCQDGTLLVNAEACTNWVGVPAIRLETTNRCNPICSGESTSYTIRVVNQGTAPETNLKIAANVSPELEIVQVNGPIESRVGRDSVEFGIIPMLHPGESMMFTIDARGLQPGDARMEVELSSDSLSKPIREEESTQVY